VFHRVTAHDFVSRVTPLQTGSSYPAVRDRDVFSQTVELPPLNEQRRIVAAIEEHLSRLDAADASLASVSRRLDAIVRPIRQRVVEGGSEMLLGDLLDDIEAGKSFKCHARPADDGEWGVVKVSSMTWGDFRDYENKAVLSEESVDPRWEIRAGDLLLSRANTTEYVGASVLVGDCRPRLLLSDKSMRLLVRSGTHKPWLLHALRAPSVRSQMSAVATGTSDSMRNISQAKVKSVGLRVPPINEQRRIVVEVEAQLSVIDAMYASIERAQRRSAALRAAILERAFRGELVPQDPADEPAEALLARIRAERAMSAGATGGRRRAVRP
jgi:type I restriction enzyme S subunit